MAVVASKAPLFPEVGDLPDEVGQQWRLLPPPARADEAVAMGDPEVWQETMTRLLLKLQDGGSEEVFSPVEAAWSAVAMAQAAAERQKEMAQKAEDEAKQREQKALAKSSEAAQQLKRAQQVVSEAQEASKLVEARLQAQEEQVEVKKQMRQVEMEETLALQRRKEAKEAAERLRDHEESLQVALRAAELRAQNRLLDADQLASTAEERAKARAKAADEEAEVAVRTAQKRMADELANLMVSHRKPCENFMKDLPVGLEERMMKVESLFRKQHGKLAAAEALQRAREAHVRLDQSQPLAAVVVTWGVLLALALDAILQLLLGAEECPKEPMEAWEMSAVSYGADGLVQSLEDTELFTDARALQELRASVCQKHSLLQLKELQQEQMRELRHLKELQLKANGAHEPPALKQEPMVEIEKAPEEGSTRSFAKLDRFRALHPEESLPITIGEVQRSVSIDRARLQEEMRTAQLQQRLRRRSLSPASPSRRPLYALPEPRAERRELPADVAARLSSSPALAAAAQHWGVPRKASTSPRRRPAAKAAAKMAARNQIPVSHGPKGGMQYGMGIARGPFSPVRALWRPSFS